MYSRRKFSATEYINAFCKIIREAGKIELEIRRKFYFYKNNFKDVPISIV